MSNVVYRISFTDKDENEIVFFDPCHSFNLSIGETVELSLINENKDIWDVNDIDETVEILDIKQTYEKRYPRTSSVSSVSQIIFVTVITDYK